jgi:predicted nucleic acid-binding protein
MSKVLVDTNILIYAKDIASIYHDASLIFLKQPDEYFISIKNLTEYYAVVTKGEKPLLTPFEAWHDLEEFSSFFTVLYPTPVSQQHLAQLILQYAPKGILIHDFEITAIALANGINKIATFNKSDFQTIKRD